MIDVSNKVGHNDENQKNDRETWLNFYLWVFLQPR